MCLTMSALLESVANIKTLLIEGSVSLFSLVNCCHNCGRNLYQQLKSSLGDIIISLTHTMWLLLESRKENPQKLTQLSSRSHPRHLVGKRTAQKDTIIDITSDSQVNSNFPYRWSPASLTFNNYFYLFFIYI